MNEEVKAVYKLHFDCGRMGELNGTFVSTVERVNKLIELELEVYFGEVLGKHSEIGGPIEDVDITLVSEDKRVVDLMTKNQLLVGHNPFEYRSYGFKYKGVDYSDMIVDDIITKILNK